MREEKDTRKPRDRVTQAVLKRSDKGPGRGLVRGATEGLVTASGELPSLLFHWLSAGSSSSSGGSPTAHSLAASALRQQRVRRQVHDTPRCACALARESASHASGH